MREKRGDIGSAAERMGHSLLQLVGERLTWSSSVMSNEEDNLGLSVQAQRYMKMTI